MYLRQRQHTNQLQPTSFFHFLTGADSPWVLHYPIHSSLRSQLTFVPGMGMKVMNSSTWPTVSQSEYSSTGACTCWACRKSRTTLVILRPPDLGQGWGGGSFQKVAHHACLTRGPAASATQPEVHAQGGISREVMGRSLSRRLRDPGAGRKVFEPKG